MLLSRENRFGGIAIILHWAIAALILGLIGLGFVVRRLPVDPAMQFALYQWHKSIGFTALGLAIIRLLWWAVDRHPAPVASLGPLERGASRAMHVALAALTLAVPLAGWAVASTSTLNIPTFYFNVVVIPHLPLEKTPEAEAFWSSAHAVGAYLMLALIVPHAAAALYHHFRRKDEVLTRMLGIGGPHRPAKKVASAPPGGTMS